MPLTINKPLSPQEAARAGRSVQVRLDVEKRKGFPDRSIVIDYKSADASGVVNLRSAS